MSNLSNISIISVDSWTCFFIDSFSENGNSLPSAFQNVTIKCSFPFEYLFRHRSFSIILLILIFTIGTFGFFANILNFTILYKSKIFGGGASVSGAKTHASSLRFLVILQSISDFLTCLFNLSFATVVLIIWRGFCRNHLIYQFLHVTHVLSYFGATAGIYLTLLVTLERYLVVAFPSKISPEGWGNSAKSKVGILSAVLIGTGVMIPSFFNRSVRPSPFDLPGFPYILDWSEIGKKLFPKIRLAISLSIALPFPVLIILNGLLYRKIYLWTRSRRHLSYRAGSKKGSADTGSKTGLNDAKMFSVVVFTIMPCYGFGCAVVMYRMFYPANVMFREVLLMQLLAFTLIASINFVVYFAMGRSFRHELIQIFCKLVGSKGRRREENEGQSLKLSDSRGHTNIQKQRRNKKKTRQLTVSFVVGKSQISEFSLSNNDGSNNDNEDG